MQQLAHTAMALETTDIAARSTPKNIPVIDTREAQTGKPGVSEGDTPHPYTTTAGPLIRNQMSSPA